MVSGQRSVVSGLGQGYVLGEGALHRGVALEEDRQCAAPQVERGCGCRGETDGEQQRDADEARCDVRRATADVLAGGGAQRRGQSGEEPACAESPSYHPHLYCSYLLWLLAAAPYYGYYGYYGYCGYYGSHVEDHEYVEEGAVRSEQHTRVRQRA